MFWIVVLSTVIMRLYSLTYVMTGATTRKCSEQTSAVMVSINPGRVANVADESSGHCRTPLTLVGQNSYGSMRHIWMLLYELCGMKPNSLTPSSLHHMLKTVNMARDGFVIQNTYLSVATAGMAYYP